MIGNIHKFFVFVAIFTTIAGLAFLSSRENVLSPDKTALIPPYSFSGYSDIIFEDGTRYRKKTPFTIVTDKSFRVILNLDNLGMIDNKTLSFITKNTTIRVEVDDLIIFRHFGTINDRKYAHSNAFILADLPKRITSNNITLHYENTVDYPSVFELKNVKIGRNINLISNLLLSESIVDYALLILMIIIFSSTLFTGSFSRESSITRQYFFYISLLSLTLFFYISCNMTLSHFIFGKYTVYLHTIRYTSLMLLPVFMTSAIMLRSDHCLPALKAAIVVATANIVIQFIFVYSDIQTFAMMASCTQIVILATLALIAVSLFGAKKTGRGRTLITRFTYLPLLVGIASEAFCMTQEDAVFSIVFKVCVAVFGLIQCYDFFSFYKTMTEERIKGQVYQKLAITDQLTGIGNRLALSEKRIDYSRMKSAFYIVLFDVNNLKYINDVYGHKYGDNIIKLLSELLEKGFGPSHQRDLFRVGGDEFVMIYHVPKNIDLESRLSEIATKYKNAKLGDIEENRFGVSYGFCYCDIPDGDDFDEKMHLADINMYQQKQATKQTTE
ncbi:MAG: hypothetical protein CSA52_02465 [Gammaproteobacteria bacterium]|nr:MAG: hypothetical protein CSB48_06450 [Pseudomonadota bacterium]PIE38448.1 MAG: hypothetical protein CSA52_02465 [Gammaproteobacteria bacterium]